MSPCLLSSLQISRWGSFTLVSLLGLLLGDEWVKVTCCLDWEGLGDWAHLLAGSPWFDIALGLMICSLGSPLLVVAQVSVASGALVTVAEGMAHPLSFILKQCCAHQGPSVGIFCCSQSFLTGVLLHIHEPVISGVVPGIEFGLEVEPRDAGWDPSWLFPQQCREATNARGIL